MEDKELFCSSLRLWKEDLRTYKELMDEQDGIKGDNGLKGKNGIDDNNKGISN
jgi:hypothetical protein